jgi:hypothetical protein
MLNIYITYFTQNMEAFNIMKRREENLRLNREFFQQLGMDEVRAYRGLSEPRSGKTGLNACGLNVVPD